MTASQRLRYATMTREQRREFFRMRAAQGPCSACRFDGINVIHDEPWYREGNPYHEANPDVPFHYFRPLAVTVR